MANFKIQTVKCVDRDSFVREVTDSNGDLVCELAVNTAERPQASKYEALIAAAPEMLAWLEFVLDTWTMDECSRGGIQEVIRKAKGE